MNDQARAMLIVGALLFGAGNGSGFLGGRMSVSAPPVEVRYVMVSAPVSTQAAPTEPAAVLPLPAPIAAPIEPPPAEIVAPAVEVKPSPPPRPKVDTKRAEPPKSRRVRAPPAKKAMPSCAVIQRQYDAMNMSQRWAAYRRATPEEIAHGKRCLKL